MYHVFREMQAEDRFQFSSMLFLLSVCSIRSGGARDVFINRGIFLRDTLWNKQTWGLFPPSSSLPCALFHVFCARHVPIHHLAIWDPYPSCTTFRTLRLPRRNAPARISSGGKPSHSAWLPHDKILAIFEKVKNFRIATFGGFCCSMSANRNLKWKLRWSMVSATKNHAQGNRKGNSCEFKRLLLEWFNFAWWDEIRNISAG